MNIVTGYRGEPHITSQQRRFINQSAFGTGSYVLPIGSQLSATIDSATQVTLADGGVSVQGCVGIIEYGQSEAIQIESGTVGMSRIDLICAEYTKDANGIEDLQLVVKTGTPSTGTPNDPENTSGTIAAGDTVVDFPLYRVTLDGVAIDSVTLIAPVVDTAETLMQKVGKIPVYWHLWRAQSEEWAPGTTTVTISVPPAPSGYYAFVVGLRTTNFNIRALWTYNTGQLTLHVNNSASTKQSGLINGYMVYFKNEFVI